VEDLAAEKKALRREIIGVRRAVSRARASSVGEAVALHLLHEPRIRKASRWALYASTAEELSMWPLFERLRALGRVPRLPRVRGRRLEFASAPSRSALCAGAFGILEPCAGVPAEPLWRGDVVVVPGLAFDPHGNRLGRGGGFYDRTFAPCGPAPLLVGAGYAFQVRARIPHGSRDHSVDAIVTENGILWTRGSR
jgi:5-formyltetrahydrofolate cyclo-ligase